MSSVLLSGQPVAEVTSASRGSVISFASSHRADVNGATIRVRSATEFDSRSINREPKLKGFVTKRRLKGFVTANIGEKWRVIFVENGKKFPYHFPSKQLREVGVTEVNQPFEMDEMVSVITGVSGKVYRFRSLADMRDSILETLPLDADRLSKRDFILSKLAKPKA